MSDPKYWTRHLDFDPERRARLREVRDLINDSKGYSTIALEIVQPVEELGEINFGAPVITRANLADTLDSDYLVYVGLQSYRIKYGNNRVGRFDDNDILIDDIYVSRRHCCIVVHSNGSAEIFDTASKNHTWVNGKRVQRCWLKSGDEIKLANRCTMIFTLAKE